MRRRTGAARRMAEKGRARQRRHSRLTAWRFIHTQRRFSQPGTQIRVGASRDKLQDPMRRRIIRTSAILMSSVASLAPQGPAKAEAPGKYAKKLRESVLARPDLNSGTAKAGDPPPP